MCPLRVLLIFISATLAGFFVLRNLRAQEGDHQQADETSPKEQLPLSSKIGSAVRSGFWTCVDMASGRYLWRNLVANSDEKNNR